MANCGDSYKGQFVTVSGLTFDDPWSVYAGVFDYEEWRETARVWSIEATARFNVLGEIEKEHAGGSFPEYNELQPLQNRMVERYQALPEYLSLQSTYNTAAAISEAQQVLVDAGCLLELSDRAIESYGFEAPRTPAISRGHWWDKVPWWGWVIMGTGGVLVTLGVVQIGLRELRLRARKNPRRR